MGCGPATSLEAEREAQRIWRLRLAHARSPAFDRLVVNEFRPEDELAAATGRALRRIVRHAVETVPWWQRRFRRLGLGAADIAGPADLARLPVLGKEALRSGGEALRARRLPDGDAVQGWFVSSGTTGQPTRVLHSQASNRMFSYLAQRQYRWFRFDPAATLAVIRPPHSLPPRADGRRHGPEATGRLSRWRYAGGFFRTGALVYASASLPAERLLRWLVETRPGYLLSYSETLEQLALACDGAWPAGSLKGFQAIAQQLTPGMRRRIESTAGAPVHIAYGLNEIGLVAAGCAAGRYHVHAEHCIVEIVDADGAPCLPGAIGRILVTGLKNPAMPLFRYDTGDLAAAVAGPCPCGRTLPTFGDIQGRYSRIAHLPPGTVPVIRQFRETVAHLPAARVAGLRQFQLHQFRDGSFELRLVTAGALPPALAATMAETWAQSGGDPGRLRVAGVAAIPLPAGGKFQDFTSEFMPAADGARG